MRKRPVNLIAGAIRPMLQRAFETAKSVGSLCTIHLDSQCYISNTGSGQIGYIVVISLFLTFFLDLHNMSL